MRKAFVGPSPWVTILGLRRRHIHIQTLRPFSPVHLISKIPSCYGRAKMLLLSVPLMTVTALWPAILPPATIWAPRTVVDSLNPSSESHIDWMDSGPNGLETLKRLLRKGIRLRRFTLTSCLYRLTSVCNSFLGCWKVPCHITCLCLIC